MFVHLLDYAGWEASTVNSVQVTQFTKPGENMWRPGLEQRRLHLEVRI